MPQTNTIPGTALVPHQQQLMLSRSFEDLPTSVKDQYEVFPTTNGETVLIRKRTTPAIGEVRGPVDLDDFEAKLREWHSLSLTDQRNLIASARAMRKTCLAACKTIKNLLDANRNLEDALKALGIDANRVAAIRAGKETVTAPHQGTE